MKKLTEIFWILFLSSSSVIVADQATSDDTFQGQPVGTAMTTDDASAYVESIVKIWLASTPSGQTPKIGPQDMNKLGNEAKRVGMANLLAAYGKTSPDVVYRMNVEYVPQNEITRGVLEKAISMIVTSADIESVLAAYAQRPLILSVLNDHPEFDQDSRVTDFLINHLDQVPDAYKTSDKAPFTFFLLVCRNKSEAIQSKFDSFLSDAIQNSDSYPNSHLYLNLLSIYGLGNPPNAILAKHLPDLITILAARAKSPPTDIYTEISPTNIFSQSAFPNLAIASPTVFADQATKDAVTKLTTAAEKNGFKRAQVFAVAAACGSKPDLIKLVGLYHDPANNGGVSSPGLVAMDRNLAKQYLSTISCQLSGDELTNVVNHIDSASYDPTTCIWTINKEAGTPTAQ